MVALLLLCGELSLWFQISAWLSISRVDVRFLLSTSWNLWGPVADISLFQSYSRSRIAWIRRGKKRILILASSYMGVNIILFLSELHSYNTELVCYFHENILHAIPEPSGQGITAVLIVMNNSDSLGSNITRSSDYSILCRVRLQLMR